MKGSAIPEVVALHARELGELWTLRRAALESADFWARDLLELERRIAGHWDALLVAGAENIDILRHLLVETDAATALAVGLALARLGGPNSEAALLEALASLEGEALERFADGLGHADIAPIRAALESIVESAEPARAALAAGILAHCLGKAPARLRALAEDPEMEIRLAAWRAVAYSSESTPSAEWDEGRDP